MPDEPQEAVHTHRRQGDPPSGMNGPEGFGTGRWANWMRFGIIGAVVGSLLATGATITVLLVRSSISQAAEDRRQDYRRTEEDRARHYEELSKAWAGVAAQTAASQNLEKAVGSLVLTGKESHIILNDVAGRVGTAVEKISQAAEVNAKAAKAMQEAAESIKKTNGGGK